MIKNYDNLVAIIKQDIRDYEIYRDSYKGQQTPGTKSSKNVQYYNGMIKALEDVIRYINADRII